MTIQQALSCNPYPGRGLLLGMTPDKKYAVLAYFIMGRSESSRNRIFERDGADLFTKPRDASKLERPELLLYAPVRAEKRWIVVGNGDQTDTVKEALLSGGDFETALHARTFEPDAPNYTARITGVVSFAEKEAQLGILCRQDGGHGCERRFYREALCQGVGLLLHTYADGDPLRPFRGAPVRVETGNHMALFTGQLWDALNADNRISLYVRYVNLKDKTCTDSLINRYA